MIICELIEQLQQFNQNSTVRVRVREDGEVLAIEAVVPVAEGEPHTGGAIEIIAGHGK